MSKDKPIGKPFLSTTEAETTSFHKSTKAPPPKTPDSNGVEPPPPDNPTASDRQAAGANGHTSETADDGTAAPPQSGKRAGWDLGGAAPEWGPLDLSGGDVKLPETGYHDAAVSDLKFSEHPDKVWMITAFSLDGWEVSPRDRIDLILSHNKIADHSKLAEGRRFLRQLAIATAIPIETIEALGDPISELPDLFIGKKVNLWVRQKLIDGIPDLLVGRVRPRLK